MAKYIVSGKQGSFVTSRKDAKRYYKVGDWTNATGDIKKVILAKRIKRLIKKK